ncbi:hypothetical protein QN277_023515 [Acacia crassicarpa]|uniref:Uncharacterized protein n=1 Tax=Acacia crassicarpa TaxID=499986 RepID=A0AAE1JJ18_9FABA|nr:hypothetical protein QN277_023515 [Acacia crassicarpa]
MKLLSLRRRLSIPPQRSRSQLSRSFSARWNASVPQPTRLAGYIYSSSFSEIKLRASDGAVSLPINGGSSDPGARSTAAVAAGLHLL